MLLSASVERFCVSRMRDFLYLYLYIYNFKKIYILWHGTPDTWHHTALHCTALHCTALHQTLHLWIQRCRLSARGSHTRVREAPCLTVSLQSVINGMDTATGTSTILQGLGIKLQLCSSCLRSRSETHRQTHTRTWRLLDQLGPVGPSWWKVPCTGD